MGRGAESVRDAQAGRERDGGGDHRLLPREDRALQSAEDGGVRPAAEDLDRQGAEVQVARQGMGRTRETDQLMATTLLTPPTADVLVELDGPLAYITLNRPAKRNALSEDVMLRLIKALHEVGKKSEIQVVVLKANGSVFSSGHDLTELLHRTVIEYKRIFELCIELMET